MHQRLHHRFNQRSRPAAALLAVALATTHLFGCGGNIAPAPPAVEQPIALPTPAMASEQLAAEAGDFALLATLYQRAAEQLAGDLKTAALLRAGELQLQLNNENAARAIARDLQGSRFEPVLRAELLMQEDLLEAAAEQLALLPANISPALRPVVASANAELLARNGEVPQALTALAAPRYSDGPLGADIEQIVNQYKRWTLLHRERVAADWLAAADSDQAGWITLADLAQRGWQQPANYLPKLLQWQTTYRNHAANQRIAPALITNAREIASSMARIALLVDDDSEAVVRGAIAARFADSGATPAADLKTFSSAGDNTAAAENVWRSIANGDSDAVIGPVSDAQLAVVQRRLRGNQKALPVVALTQPTAQNNNSPRSLVIGGLDPANDVRSLADHATSRGLRRAVLLAPAGKRGDRIKNTLLIRLAELNGDVLASESYAPSQRDFSPLLSRLLNIDTSNEREQDLARLLGETLASSDRGRSDVDFLVIDASGPQAIVIAKQLQSLGVNRLPIYATGKIFAGNRNASRDSSLNGIRFAALPWHPLNGQLTPRAAELAALWPSDFEQNTHQYALGFDAYQLLPLVLARSSTPQDTATDSIWRTSLQQAWLPGASGTLSISNNGAVMRQLPIALFRNGVPVVTQ